MRLHGILGCTAKWLFIGLAPPLLVCCAKTESSPTLVVGNARFEFLTPSLVRMEYSPSGAFVDAPTAVVQKRDWPKVPVQATHKDGWLIAASSDMTVRYRLESGAFAAANLEARGSAFELLVLRGGPDHGVGKEDVVLADRRVVDERDHGVDEHRSPCAARRSR